MYVCAYVCVRTYVCVSVYVIPFRNTSFSDLVLRWVNYFLVLFIELISSLPFSSLRYFDSFLLNIQTPVPLQTEVKVLIFFFFCVEL